MANSRYVDFAFLALFLGVGYLFYLIFKPFLPAIIVAVLLTSLFFPLFRRLERLFKGRRRLASISCCIAVTLLIVLPGIALISLITSESYHLYGSIDEKIRSGYIQELVEVGQESWAGRLLDSAKHKVELDEIDLVGSLSTIMQNLSSFLFTKGSDLLKNFSNIIINFFIMIFTMYYLFLEGQALVKQLMYISPLPDRYERRIIEHFGKVSAAAIKGTLITALSQGTAGGIGFWILGLSSPVLWGTVMAFFSLIPMVGTAIVWAPASLFLFATGHWIKGLILICWGGLFVAMIDNFLKPMLIESQTKLHPLLIFFSILGGIKVFGLLGIVLGPTVLAVFLTVLEIYKEEFGDCLDAQREADKG